MSTIYNVTNTHAHISLPSHTDKQRNIKTLEKYVEREREENSAHPYLKGGLTKKDTGV